MSDAVLQVEGLAKRYGKRMAVDGLSFEVRRGDIYGFLGRNGAGKSTSLRMILGLIRPTAGKIFVCDQPVHAGRHPGNWPVGAIVESPLFYDYIPARKNLEMLASLSGGASRSRIDEIVELVGLTERQHENVSVYSHGMRQRLGLAQALLPDPDLIMLDEPLDGLDPNGIRHLRDVMHNVVTEHGVTIFFSSHILSEVELTCNRVLVIEKGKKITECDTADLMADTNRVRLRVEADQNPTDALGRLDFVDSAAEEEQGWLLSVDPVRVPELNRALVEAGLGVLELAPIKTRLEDVFIDMTEGEGADSAGVADSPPPPAQTGETP